MDAPVDVVYSEEKLARLRLARSERVGAITFRHLIDRYKTAVAAIEELPRLAAKGGGRKKPRIPSPEEISTEVDAARSIGARHLVFGEADYPEALAAIDDAPPVLLLKGRTDLLAGPAVGIVGARNASAAGRKIARMLAEGLSAAGYVVVSGLARGIDTAAHEGALSGGTVAVLGGGVDVPYPRENARHYKSIGTEGLLVSEYPPGTSPQARHFPRRNRIISGLSLGLVVVEAAARSGSLISARLAGEQGRQVFAVPGSPLDPRAAGANRLIREGAVLVRDIEDVLAEIDGTAGRIPRPTAARDLYARTDRPGVAEAGDELVDGVAGQLSPAPVEIDEIARNLGISAAMVQSAILELELAGRAIRHPGNRASSS